MNRRSTKMGAAPLAWLPEAHRSARAAPLPEGATASWGLDTVGRLQVVADYRACALC